MHYLKYLCWVHYREYLLSRSLVTASPEDSSFFSQPDDFGSAQDMDDLEEFQLSTGLMHCLDGHHPYERNGFKNTVGHFFSAPNSNLRKRIAIQDDGLVEIDNDKLVEIDANVDSQFVINEYKETPGETSF